MGHSLLVLQRKVVIVAEQLDADQLDLIKRFFEARKNAGGWKKAADALRIEIEESFGEILATEGSLANTSGEFVGKIRLVPGKKLDVKRLRAERPEIYAEFDAETLQVRIEEPK